MTGLYNFEYKPRKTIGLARKDYKGTPLHHPINCSTLSNTGAMPIKTYASPPTGKLPDTSKSKVLKDGGSNKNVESSSEEDRSADIQPTKLGKNRETKISDTKLERRSPRANNGKKASTIRGHRTRNAEATVDASPSSSNSSIGTKRKSPGQGAGIAEDRFQSSKSMVDPFGRNPKKSKPGYGRSSQPQIRSSQPSQASQKTARSPPASPPRKSIFSVPDAIDFDSSDDDSPQKGGGLKMPDDLEQSPVKFESLRTPPRKFAEPDKLDNSPIGTPEAPKGFRDPNEIDSQIIPDYESGESFLNMDKRKGSPISSPFSSRMLPEWHGNNFQERDAKTLLELKKGELGGELAARVGDILGHDDDDLMPDSSKLFDDSVEYSTKVTARCPMCRQPCDPVELKKWGYMDTRKQERFCRTHQKLTAESKWSSKGYPEIDWDKMDSRITEHHDFIKCLINGQECESRRSFARMVAAGKGRSLRKQESNLTPGYYGTRGLNSIADHVVCQFAVLLSERSVQDPLVSKRGTATFVQSVVVPEVAVQLIREDMNIGDLKARDILLESSKLGELVHEEVKDVVTRRIQVSEDDEGEVAL